MINRIIMVGIALLLTVSIALADDDCICDKQTDCCLQGNCFDADAGDTWRLQVCPVPGDVDCDGDADYCVPTGSGGQWGDCGPGCSFDSYGRGAGDWRNPCCPDENICVNYDCVAVDCDAEPGYCVEDVCNNGVYLSTYCCGDDSIVEDYNYCRLDRISASGNWAGCGSGDDACCNGEDCVRDGRCYSGGGHTLYASGNDRLAGCVDRSGEMTWVDLDFYQSECGNVASWLAAGESGVGEYTANGGGIQCCGDDGEYVGEFLYVDVYEKEGVASCKGIDTLSDSCNSDDEACCDSSIDCVYQGNCYSSGMAHQIGIQSDLKTLCAGPGFWEDCDNSNPLELIQPDACEACGGTWMYGAGIGEYSASGETECCGDDQGENVRSRAVITGYDIDFGVDSSDSACCATSTGCVAGSNCFDTSAAYDIRTYVPDNDLRSWCAGGKWADCDINPGVCRGCGYSWYPNGETAAIGEYNNPNECCGDDQGENAESRKIGTTNNDNIDFQPDPNDAACCSASGKCVANGKCYSTGIYDLRASGPGLNGKLTEEDDRRSMCAGSVWWDCDMNPGVCSSCNASDPTINYEWAMSGETGIPQAGEYTDTTTKECCGDDEGEYYTCNVLNPSTCKCCNEENDVVSTWGECYNCGMDADPCFRDSDCCGSLGRYCSAGPGNQDDRRCCPKGSYWDGDECKQTQECSPICYDVNCLAVTKTECRTGEACCYVDVGEAKPGSECFAISVFSTAQN